MNKRIYFILFPILALLFINNSRDRGIIPSSEKTAGLSISTTAFQNIFPSPDLKKEEKKLNIYAIRIKAKHNAVAMNVPVYWEPICNVVYYAKAYCESNQAYELYAYRPEYNLRGPPSII